MSQRGWMALCMSVALVAAACGEVDNDSTLDPLEENAPATDSARPSAGVLPADRGADQIVSGNLGKVDPDTRSFTLIVDNREQAFRFDDTTQVTGAAGTQGLAGRQGARVTVHYRQEGGGNMATRIMLEGAMPPSSAEPSRPAPSEPGRGAPPSGIPAPERR